MSEEYNMKSTLIRTLCAMILCILMILLKVMWKEEVFLEEVYNYLVSDIVFLG